MKNQESIVEILNRRLNSAGLGKAALAARVCGAANEVARSDFEDYFEAVSYRSGTLKIRTRSSAAAHLLKLQEKQIIGKIKNRVGAELNSIVFEIKEGRSEGKI